MAYRKSLPSAELLWELFDYNVLEGELYWRKKPAGNVDVSTPAGSYDRRRGYRVIWINNKSYLGHRVAWKWVHGTEPGECLDHVGQEGVKVKRNHIWGLEEVTLRENLKRAASKRDWGSGITWHKRCRRWQAQWTCNGTNRYLGMFADKRDAIDAVKKFREGQQEA